MQTKNVIVEKSLGFSIEVIKFCELLEAQKKFVIARQLLRSGTSVGANVFEAQHAESKADFIHKMKVALKELRESFNALRIVQTVKWLATEKLDSVLDENNQLISIFVKSIETATRNDQKNIRQGTRN